MPRDLKARCKVRKKHFKVKWHEYGTSEFREAIKELANFGLRFRPFKVHVVDLLKSMHVSLINISRG